MRGIESSGYGRLRVHGLIILEGRLHRANQYAVSTLQAGQRKAMLTLETHNETPEKIGVFASSWVSTPTIIP